MRATASGLALSTLLALSAHADCGVERWPVKTASDAEAVQVSANVIPTTIAALRAMLPPRPLFQANRIAPVEMTTYSVTATLVELRRDDDGDDYLVLADESGRTMIAEIPAPDCVPESSAFRSSIVAARQAVESHFSISSTFQHPAVPVEVRGIGFFDYLQQQPGSASNGIELHPVTSVNFTPAFTPAPPLIGRRRATNPIGGSSCAKPVLTLRASPSTACALDPITLEWESSDPSATVSIEGVGLTLPANGAAILGATGTIAYAGQATNVCGAGNEAVAVVNIVSAATASLSLSSTSIGAASSAVITLTTSNAQSWTLTSSLGNPLGQSSGTTNGTRHIDYTGSHSGNDTITLNVASACGSLQRIGHITVGSGTPVPPPPTPPTPPTPPPTPPPPPPTPPVPPPSGGLFCKDGTRSPTCFTCKSGCCSGHGGVAPGQCP